MHVCTHPGHILIQKKAPGKLVIVKKVTDSRPAWSAHIVR